MNEDIFDCSGMHSLLNQAKVKIDKKKLKVTIRVPNKGGYKFNQLLGIVWLSCPRSVLKANVESTGRSVVLVLDMHDENLGFVDDFDMKSFLFQQTYSLVEWVNEGFYSTILKNQKTLEYQEE